MTRVWVVIQKIKTIWELVLPFTMDQDIIHNTLSIAFATPLFLTFLNDEKILCQFTISQN